MKLARACLAASLAISSASASGEAVNPLSKVVELLSGLQQKVIAQGEQEQKIYAEASEVCEDRARQLHFEIKTGKGQAQELKAVIEEETSRADSLGSKIEDLGGSTAEDEAELKAAEELRKKEATTFQASEKELLEMLSALKRASGIIQRQGGSASLMQTSGSKSVLQVLETMVEANAINFDDATRLTALVQSGSSDSDSDEADDSGAPSAAAYESKSGTIQDVLDSLTDKTEDQLEALRKKETESLHTFEMKKQSLEDQIKFGNKDMGEAKKGLATANEKKASAQGDLTSVSKDLTESVKALSELHHDCMEKASTFEEATKSRSEELKALATAKKAITDMTGAAEDRTYGDSLAQEDEDAAPALVQVKAMTKAKAKAKNSGPGLTAVHLIRRLAMASQSSSLAQLASRIGVALRAQGSQGEDPFEKVKGMISDMIAKLEDEAGADAKKKAWCDKETAETTAKKEDKEGDIEKLTTQIDQMTASSVRLQEEVAVLNKELSALLKFQAEADKVRMEEKTEFNKAKPELEAGLEGVKTALKVLKEYYSKADSAAHETESGGATGIIGMLEVVESDFSQQLAEVVAEEERALQEYTVMSKENEIEKATKEADVKYKRKESSSLDKAVSEAQGDRSSTKEEYAAIMQYWKQIEKACSAKAEPYEKRVEARAKEIEGLKQALDTLDSQASLVQRRVRHRTLRGGMVLAAH